jgi:hypothetical protein
MNGLKKARKRCSQYCRFSPYGSHPKRLVAMGSCTLNPDSEAKMIVLDRHSALIDETIAIRIEGLSPRQPVTITATQTLYHASRWQAQAIFVGDHSGCVDVAHQPPISGRL